jgi:TIR domain-containing protein
MSSPSSIFLSYRRSDTQDVAGRLFDELSSRFGRRKVFKDVDSIPIASDFRDYIIDQIKYSVVLVLIGPGWLAQKALDDKSRLWDEGDFVRLEIEAALQFDSPLVPVLVNDAKIPARELLPPSIAAIRSKQGIAVRPDPNFRADVRRLTGLLDDLLRDGPERKRATAEMLDELFANCQAWYNDIVKTVAQIVAVIRDRRMDEAERNVVIDGIQLVYQNSRTYVPKVLSARKILTRYEGVDRIAVAVDEFLSHIYVHTNDRSYSAYCRPPLDWVVREEDRSGLLFMRDASPEARFASNYMEMSLAKISDSLQNLSDAIAEAKLLQ